MQSIFRYPGGKTKPQVREWITSYCPKGMREYREPFVGGGGIFFAFRSENECETTGRLKLSTPSRFERYWLNDRHEGLIAVYEALRDRPDEFIAACKAIEPEREDDPLTEAGVRNGQPTNKRLKGVFDSLKLNPDCDQALRYFFVNRTVHGSGRVNYDIPSRLYFSNPSGWNIVRNGSLDKAAAVMQGVKITCGDYATVFDAPGKDVWIYADPPYVVNSNLQPSSQIYQHSFTMDDHRRFAEVVKRCKHKVCVSYDDDEEGFIRSLYPADQFHIEEGGWKYAGTSAPGPNGEKEKKRRGRELLILNYERPADAIRIEPNQSDKPLTDAERDALKACERKIADGIRRRRDSFVAIGLALKEIRDSGKPSRRLYRQTHDTFEDYCKERWGFNDSRARQLILAAERYESLKTVKNLTVLPSTESHVAALAGCDSDSQAAEVWQSVVESVEDPKQITAAKVRKAVNEATGYTPAVSDPVEAARKALLKLSAEQIALLFSEFLKKHGEAA